VAVEGPLRVGDRVSLSADFQRHGDASKGCLSPGDVGELVAVRAVSTVDSRAPRGSSLRPWLACDMAAAATLSRALAQWRRGRGRKRAAAATAIQRWFTGGHSQGASAFFINQLRRKEGSLLLRGVLGAVPKRRLRALKQSTLACFWRQRAAKAKLLHRRDLAGVLAASDEALAEEVST